MNLEQYAAQYGKQEQPADEGQTMAAISAEANKKEAENRQAEDLKISIEQQLEQGREPQYILYTALKCIGLLSHDAEWTEAQTGRLDRIYKGLEQESFVTDNAAVALKRLHDQGETYSKRLQTQAQRQLTSYQKLIKQLEAIIETLDAEPPETDTATAER